MSRNNKKARIATALAIVSIAALMTGCGSSSGGGGAGVGGGVGLIGNGLGNGTCYPLTSTGGQIGFTGQYNSIGQYDILAGLVPSPDQFANPQPYGLLTLGSSGVAGQFNNISWAGTLSLAITPVSGYYPGQVGTVGTYGGYMLYPGAQPANVSGYISMSSAGLQDLACKMSGIQGGVTNVACQSVNVAAVLQNTCVSSVALSLQFTYGNGVGGNGYLYLNNGNAAYTVQF